MKFEVIAPATIGNVSSGFDILGLAVDQLGDHFYVESAKQYSIETVGRDAALVPTDPKRNTVTLASEDYYQMLGVPSQPFRLKIDRSLPLSGGLGSSAASSVAGALAAAKLTGTLDRRDLIMQAALHAEAAVSGKHLDNIAPCLLGGLALVQDVEKLQVYSVPIKLEFWITLITPNVKVQTKDARRVLASSLTTAEWTQQMAHCTTLALAFAQGDAEQVAFGLRDPFAEPARSPLIPLFKEAQERAIGWGAYGFCISGSGPTCFAICPTEEKAKRVAQGVAALMGPDTRTYVVRPRLTGAEIIE